MIQQTNARQASTSIAPLRQSQDSPDIWGKWSGRKHYSLEVLQHPLRARMCGFGDKDRRPLAPAAVAKMIVKGEDDNPIDVDEVDCSFFLVTVDLWSGDGKHEMNLVLHPSSAERHPPPHSARPKRRGASNSSVSHPRSSGNQTPISRTTPTPVQYRPGEQPGYNSQGYFPPAGPDQTGFSPSTPYSATTSEAPTWNYNAQSPTMERNNTFPPPLLPSIHTFAQSDSEPGTSTFRAYTGTPYIPPDAYANSQVDPALRAPPDPDGREWSQTERYVQETYPSTTPQQLDNAIYTPASYAQHPLPPQPPQHSSHYPPHVHATPSQPQSSNLAPARHSYTRTLVGPLSSNASRLLDEHRKPGIFFLFQDLSIRTEGTFRLRLRLMNVGAPPAPDMGASRVHSGVSPVLAQTFTDPFIVFSAKRFPGVPDTTALSIAFGNQGQKLPLRNRHGASKRRRPDSSGSESDSDEA